MKKFKLLLILCLCFFSITMVKAAEAKKPTTVPEIGTKMNATLDEGFDFSEIKFSSEPQGIYITGRSDMKKIFLSDGGETEFSAYCLDSSKNYPLKYSFLASEVIDQDFINNGNADILTATVLFSDPDLKELFKEVEGYSAFKILEDDTSGYYELPAIGGTFTRQIEFIKFYKNFEKLNSDEPFKVIDHNEICSEKGISCDEGYYLLQYNPNEEKSDLQYSKYTVRGWPGEEIDIDNDGNYDVYELPSNKNNIDYYNAALWIIEHSYPTLELEESLSVAGVSYDELREEIGVLHPEADENTIKSLIDSYVYSTVQYAIWKKTDGYSQETDDGGTYKLGNILYGSDQLNILYQYLIKDRTNEINSYQNRIFNNKISITEPEKLYSENTDKNIYVFGPYKVSVDMVSTTDISLSLLDDASNSGVKIIDKNGNAINSINNYGEFYLQVSRTAKISSIKVNVSAEGTSYDDAKADRARIYEPVMSVDQTVASGGNLISASSETQLEVVLNPKTGIQDISLIILVGIIAFSVGYLMLRYKGDTLEL